MQSNVSLAAYKDTKQIIVFQKWNEKLMMDKLLLQVWLEWNDSERQLKTAYAMN